MPIQVRCPECRDVVYTSPVPDDTQRMAEIRAQRFLDRHAQYECKRRRVILGDGTRR